MHPVGSTFIVSASAAVGPRIVGTNVYLERIDERVARGHGRTDEGWVDVQTDGHTARSTVAATWAPDPVVLVGTYRFETEGANALVLRSFRASPATDDDAGWTDPSADDGDWTPVVPGAWSYQLTAEPDRPYPIPVRYRVPLDVDVVPERLELVIDGFEGSAYELFLNGERVTVTPVRSSFDAQMRSVELTPLVRTGRNVIGVRLVVEEATGGIVDIVKLTGSFALAGDAASGHRIVAPADVLEPGPWTDQGYPYLSGTGVYRRTFDLPASFVGHRLFLTVPMGDDVLEVHVNGAPAGVRLWDPYVVEVTDLVHRGANELSLAVTNTLANLLNGVARPSGLAGAPSLVPHASFTFDLGAVASAERPDG